MNSGKSIISSSVAKTNKVLSVASDWEWRSSKILSKATTARLTSSARGMLARLLQCLYQPSPLYSHDLVSGYAILTLHDLREENRLLIDRYIRRILFVGNDMAIKR